MNITLSEFFTYLMTEKNFYARVANGIRRVASPGLKTMAVGIQDGRLCLYYDPEFLKNASMGFGIFVLEHEMMHLVLDHLPRFFELLAKLHRELDRKKARMVYQIAMDCAVNTNMRKNKYFALAQNETQAMVRWVTGTEPDEKDGMVLPEKYDLGLNESFESYQRTLMSRVKNDIFDGDGIAICGSTLEALIREVERVIGESHSMWCKSLDKNGNETNPGDIPELGDLMPEELQGLAQQIRTQLKQVLKKAVRDQRLDRGLIPGEIAEVLQDYLADPIVPWWELLTSRVKTAKRSKPDRGIARPNRMLLAMSEEDGSIIPALGVTRDPRFRIFFYVDTSGSMSTESLQIARSELSHLLKAEDDLEIRYMQGDAMTHFDKVFRSGEELPKEMLGRGGTDFDEYFRHMGKYVGNDETAPDIVIVYTDGYAPGVAPQFRLPPEVPVIWLLTPRHSAEQLKNYGEVIVCDKSQNDMWQHQK